MTVTETLTKAGAAMLAEADEMERRALSANDPAEREKFIQRMIGALRAHRAMHAAFEKEAA